MLSVIITLPLLCSIPLFPRNNSPWWGHDFAQFQVKKESWSEPYSVNSDGNTYCTFSSFLLFKSWKRYYSHSIYQYINVFHKLILPHFQPSLLLKFGPAVFLKKKLKKFSFKFIYFYFLKLFGCIGVLIWSNSCHQTSYKGSYN